MNKDIEFEGRVLEIDIASTKKKLSQLNSKKPKKYTFRRYVFDIIPKQKGKWIRLRTNGKRSTLTMKSIVHDGVDGTLEWEVAVSDFDRTLKILQNSGFTYRSYQENTRIEYKLPNGTVSIDFWPKIPAYLEIEAPTKKDVFKIVKMLGYKTSEVTGINNEKIYKKHGIDINKIKNLVF